MFIVKVPGINGLGKTKGCERAGNALLEALKEEIFSNEEGKPIEFEKLDLEEIHLDNSNLELTNKLIYENAFESFEEHPKVVFLGGDHSISYSLTRAFFDYIENKGEGKKPCLIVFDAHPDVMEPVDRKFPTHEEWLRNLIEDGFPVDSILLVGVRNSDPKELAFLKEKGIKMISMNKLNQDLREVTDVITEFASGKELYVSIDIDVIDPAFAPSTGYKEPGGLTSRQFLYILQRINKIKSLRALDIVEINEQKDKENNGLTIKLGAKILSEII
jgi:arginase family enzyme